MINNSIVFLVFLLLVVVVFFFIVIILQEPKRIKYHKENESYRALTLQVLCKEFILQQCCYYQVNDITVVSSYSQGFDEALMDMFRCLGLHRYIL